MSASWRGHKFYIPGEAGGEDVWSSSFCNVSNVHYIVNSTSSLSSLLTLTFMIFVISTFDKSLLNKEMEIISNGKYCSLYS